MIFSFLVQISSLILEPAFINYAYIRLHLRPCPQHAFVARSVQTV